MKQGNTLMGARMLEAIEKKAREDKKTNNGINSFIWKGRKVEVNGHFKQDEKRLVDCTEEELNGFYKHCESMLWNKSDSNPGRYVLLSIIKDQRIRCNAELFLRWLQNPDEVGFPIFKFREALRGFLDTNKDTVDPDTFPISGVLKSDQCPAEFADIPCSIVLEGCLDRLGRFDKKHLTLSFILKQGLWFTPQESKDLTEKDEEGNIRDRVDVVRERHGILPSIEIRTTPKGLSYSQFRAMLNLKSKKYSELTTDQLRLLRDRILFSLEDDVRKHAEQWKTREQQILEVMEFKGFALPNAVNAEN